MSGALRIAFRYDGEAGRRAIDPAQLMALDRASVREIDPDGHLHVAEANVCREGVSPYYGSEIPNYATLGLDPGQTYWLYRPAVELRKAVASANGKPVLRLHRPVSADDHEYWDTIGSTGTNARWEAPYVKNALVIWPGPDIAAIKSDAKKEISPGYRYTAVMHPGAFDGQHYDGRMAGIGFNHFAVVEEGRQGSDIVIGDSAGELQWAAKETRCGR